MDSPNQLEDLYEAIPFSLEEYSSMRKLFKSSFDVDLAYSTFIKRFDTSMLVAK